MFKKLIDGLPLGLSVLALATAIFIYSQELNRDITRNIIVENGVETEVTEDGQAVVTLDGKQLAQLLNRIDETERRANNSANSADVILGFIEGGFTLLGVLIAIATVVFGLSIQDVRSRLAQSIKDADDRFDANEQKLEQIIAQLKLTVQSVLEGGEDRIRHSVERVTRLTQEFEKSIHDTETAVSGMRQIIDEAVESAKADAEKSFRVLSLLLLAEQQVRARNRTTAIATLEEAFRLDPNNQTTNYLLGYLYVGRKQFDLATDHLQRALDITPDFAPALAAMGLAQRRMGDAIRDSEREMERNQLWARAEYNLTRALYSDPALIDADNESYFGTLGGLYRRQKRYEDALKAYENAVNITPNNSYPVTNLATLYKKLGYEDQAEHTFRRAIEISNAILDDQPGDTWARLDLAQSQLVVGEFKKAQETYRDVISRINEASPLETAYSGLEFLADSPKTIAGINEVMDLLQESIRRLQEKPAKFSDHT